MIEILAWSGVLSRFSFAQQQTTGTRDIKALSVVAANDSETPYRPILAQQNAAFAVAFSLDRHDPVYTVAFSAI